MNDAPAADPGPIGVLVMAYGTPATAADVEPYYTHIRRGRPPSPEQLANLQLRYDALGGTSTLARRTADQVAAIAAVLDHDHPGRFVVELGQKHAHPFIEDGVAALADAGCASVVGVVLAPHYSGFSVGQYRQRVADAAAAAGIEARGIDRWHDLHEYRRFLAHVVDEALVHVPQQTEVVFTAHSLPERVLQDDPYADELAESAWEAADDVGLRPRQPDDDGRDHTHGLRWSVAWQSAGATPEPWRGPDILEVIRDRAATGEVDGILVCPQGFVADHLEVAYDLDIEAKAVADEVGLAFARTRVLNDDAVVLRALAHRVAHVALAPVAD